MKTSISCCKFIYDVYKAFFVGHLHHRKLKWCSFLAAPIRSLSMLPLPTMIPKLACCYNKCCSRQLLFWTTQKKHRFRGAHFLIGVQESNESRHSFGPFSIIFKFLLHYNDYIGSLLDCLILLFCFLFYLLRVR
jgi:hypothetical protein